MKENFKVSDGQSKELEMILDDFLINSFMWISNVFESYINTVIDERSKNNSGIKSCSDCDAYDGEREGCTMPSCDMDYACSQRAVRNNE